ncbi:MAG: hypothetical protein ACRDLS_08230 [Solirubrobacteraceae bacterium]
MICQWDDVPWKAHEHGELRYERQRLGAAAGSANVGLSRFRIAPGARHMPQHVHADEEELFVVLDGDEFAVRRGSVVARPAATGVAHDFQAGDGGMSLQAYGTREPNDICWYPDSRKLYFIGIDLVARVEPLDYWDGEG